MTVAIVCGGRTYADRPRLFQVLDELHDELQFTKIIQGGANGADTMAGWWAKERGIECHEEKADWGKYKKSAGAIRNQAMLNMGPNIVIAFPGGSGTTYMKTISRKRGVEVREVQ